jgi:plastocyanin
MAAALRKNKFVTILFMLGFIATVVTIPISFSYKASAAVTTTTSAVGVQVGGGSSTNPLFGYTPQNVEINVGQTVIWYVRPLAPAEPHTVTFVFDNKTMINGFLPSNQRVYSPAIIDSNGVTKIYPPNASFTITGTEKYVNSGWMFPRGPVPGTSNTFSVTFQKAGTYNYLCLLHPWMTGKVVVAAPTVIHPSAMSFHARGTIGGFIIPTSATTNFTSAIHGAEGSVTAGNWSFDVIGGSLQNFKVNIQMLGLDGKTEMTHTISGLKNPTSVMYTYPSGFSKIFLNNNSTSFQGAADITWNGRVIWSDVPVFVSLINGKLLNLSIDSTKTNDHFTGIPIFGIVTSLTK